MRQSILIIVSLIIGSFHLSGQKGIEVGGHAGIGYYTGDLNTSYNLSKPGVNLGFKFRRNFNNRVSLATGLDYASVSGSDSKSNNAFQEKRNLDFSSNVFDLNFAMEFNFFPYTHGSDDEYFTPYLFTGFSIIRYNPTTELEGITYDLREMGTEGQGRREEYLSLTGALVYGIGFKWDINRDWSLNANLSGRKLFTDYIDDVSGNWPDLNELERSRGGIAVSLSNRSGDPDFAKAGRQRGNGKNNDSLYYLQFGIMRYFGQLECPEISKIKNIF